MKEWKGNSRAAQYALAVNKKDSQEVREADDFYATDPVALQKLLDGCSEWLQSVFTEAGHRAWECACGNGNLAECLKANGWVVIASDLKDRGYGLKGVDFLDPQYDSTFQRVILTNPPFSLANEFILQALDILPEGGVYVALMNLNSLAGIARYENIYSKGTLREIYIFSKRIGCWKNNERNDNKSHIMNYAWYVFQKGYTGQPTLYWL